MAEPYKFPDETDSDTSVNGKNVEVTQTDNDVEVEGAKDGELVVANGDNVGARVGDAVGLDAEGQLVITFLKLHSALASTRCCSEG